MFLFIPIGTNRPRQRVPIATYSLMGANVLFFAVQCCFADHGVKAFGFVPSHPSAITALSAMFSHGGVLHLAGNLLFLWLFGTIAEDVLGAGVFLGFYFGGEIGAMLLDVNMSRWLMPGSLDVPRMGASGAIAGVLGLAAYCFPRALVKVWFFLWYMIVIVRSGTFEIRASAFLGLWISMQVIGLALQHVLGQAGGTAYWAHLGGFLAGMGAAWAFGLRRFVGKKDLLEKASEASSAYTAAEPLKDLEQLAKEDSQDPEVWAALSRAAETAGRTDEALRAYERLIPLLLRSGQQPRAARAFIAATQFAPGLALAPPEMFAVAEALTDLGEWAYAARTFRGLAERWPDSPQCEIALARTCEIAAQSLNDLALFDDAYRALCERFPQSAWRDLLKPPRTREPAAVA